MNYENFSSMPPNEERQFAVYEERSQTSEKQAMKLGLIVAGATLAVVFLFALIVPPQESEYANSGGGAAAAESGEKTDELGAE